MADQAHDEDGDPTAAAQALAEQWRAARRSLVELTERLPESRVSRATQRAGWTVKHELASVASLDDEVAHLLQRAREHAPVHLDASAVRRMRGQAMHAAQELRLTPLREHLAAAGESTAQLIEDGSEFLATSITLAGHGTTTLREHVHAQLERARTAMGVLGQHLD